MPPHVLQSMPQYLVAAVCTVVEVLRPWLPRRGGGGSDSAQLIAHNHTTIPSCTPLQLK